MLQRRNSILLNIVIWVLLLIMLLWVLFPFYWAFLNSVKHPSDTFRLGTWVPWLTFKPTLNTWILQPESAAKFARRC